MKYEEFQKSMVEALQKKVEEGVNISLYFAQKCNNQTKVGVLFEIPEHIQSPVIYLEGAYNAYQSGVSINELVNEILKEYENLPEVQFEQVIELCRHAEFAKNNVVFKLINTEQNQKLLQSVPHREIGDLSVLYYLLIDSDAKDENATMLVENKFLDIWEMNEEELYEKAAENTIRYSPLRFRSMGQIIAEMLDENNGQHMEIDMNDAMFVLTNEKGIWGATALLYDEVLSHIAEKFGENLYIIPSSIHELIIVPESMGVGEGELNEMIEEINSTTVEPEERLSNHVYFFDREQGTLKFQNCVVCEAVGN